MSVLDNGKNDNGEKFVQGVILTLKQLAEEYEKKKLAKKYFSERSEKEEERYG